MAACVYCGLDAGDYDEHDACVELALEEAIVEEELELELEQAAG